MFELAHGAKFIIASGDAVGLAEIADSFERVGEIGFEDIAHFSVVFMGAALRLGDYLVYQPEFKKVGEALGAQALIFGTVVDFGETRTGTNPAPEVTVQLKLVESHFLLTFSHS